jgi:hypothetical protein
MFIYVVQAMPSEACQDDVENARIAIKFFKQNSEMAIHDLLFPRRAKSLTHRFILGVGKTLSPLVNYFLPDRSFDFLVFVSEEKNSNRLLDLPCYIDFCHHHRRRRHLVHFVHGNVSFLRMSVEGTTAVPSAMIKFDPLIVCSSPIGGAIFFHDHAMCFSNVYPVVAWSRNLPIPVQQTVNAIV